MKRHSLYVLICVAALGSLASAQPLPNVDDGFKLGMTGFEYMTADLNPWCKVAVSNSQVGGYKSSQLNVLAEDGFDIVYDYGANWSNANMDRVLELVAANGLQMLIESKQFYKPDTPVQDGA